MKIQWRIASFAVVIGLLVLPLRPAFGQSAAIQILVSNGVKTVIDEIRPEWERAAGHPLALEYGTTAALKARVERGEVFDLAVLTSDAIRDLIRRKGGGVFTFGTRALRDRAGQTCERIQTGYPHRRRA